tara:strand:- start:192 stop:707 length:516 start_codon:yes stop_codon:yes gene_type:complete
MSQPSDSSPSYRQLAKTGAEIQRMLDGKDMERFSSICMEVGEFDVRLLFGFEDSQVKVVGTIKGSVTHDCSRCNLPVGSELFVSIDALVFESEDRLQVWLGQDNNLMNKEVVVSGPSLNLNDLVEDELILGLPRAICSQCKSDNEENYVYSAGPKVANKSPFAELSDLSSS